MYKSKSEETFWDWEIKKETSWLGATSKELYAYKDLLFRLTRKEFLGSYQQTLLGPLWALLSPLLTVLTYVFVFNNVIGISTGKVPPFLFNLIGITIWNLFSEVYFSTSKTFVQNVQIFSKVYFPRIIASLSAVGLQLILFGIQVSLLIVVFLFYVFFGKISFNASHLILMVPAIILTAGFGFGLGLIFAILTAKYRDISALMQIFMRLFMFVCPIFYSLEMVPERVKWYVSINPLSFFIELFRLSFTGVGQVSMLHFLYSTTFTVGLVVFSILLFNKWSDKLMDVL